MRDATPKNQKPMPRRRVLALTVTVLSMCLLTVAAAQQQGPTKDLDAAKEAAAQESERLITRVYDIRDLIVQVQHYPFRDTMLPTREVTLPVRGGGGGGGVFSPTTARSSQELV